MKAPGFYLFICIFFTTSTFSNIQDSSELIFDSTKVYNYRLDFYVQDWQKALEVAFDSGKQYIPAKFTYGDIIFDSIGVRYKGNSSEMMSKPPKKPYKLKFDKYKDYEFFGLTKLSLSNSFKDPSFMRERICYKIARQFLPASRTAYTNLFIGDSLIGLYVQVEDVDKKFLTRHFEDNDYNLYGVEDKGATLEYLGDDKILYDSILSLETNEDIGDWSGLTAMLKALNNTPDSNFESTMKDYLNLDGCARLFALDMVLSHFDSYTGSSRNFFLYDDSSAGCFQMIPWDFNEGFGAYTNGWQVTKQDVIVISNLAKRPLNRRITELEPLKQKYLHYIQAMINGPFSPDSIAAMADQIKPMIDAHVKADNNKLYSYQNFLDNSERDVYLSAIGTVPGIKSFAQLRNANLQEQLKKYLVDEIINTNSGVNKAAHVQVIDNRRNGMITISFTTVPGIVPTVLTIFNSKGCAIQCVSRGGQSGRTNDYLWDAQITASGYYFLEIRNDSSKLARKSFIILR